MLKSLMGCADGSPFASPVLLNSAFLTFLCPMVKKLSLCQISDAITPDQFAAICTLSMLEDLTIEGGVDDVVCSASAPGV
jgi:hypothetical protein